MTIADVVGTPDLHAIAFTVVPFVSTFGLAAASYRVLPGPQRPVTVLHVGSGGTWTPRV